MVLRVTIRELAGEGVDVSRVRVLVYGLRRGGEDETELHVRDVAKRTDLPDMLPRGLYRVKGLVRSGTTTGRPGEGMGSGLC